MHARVIACREGKRGVCVMIKGLLDYGIGIFGAFIVQGMAADTEQILANHGAQDTESPLRNHSRFLLCMHYMPEYANLQS